MNTYDICQAHISRLAITGPIPQPCRHCKFHLQNAENTRFQSWVSKIFLGHSPRLQWGGLRRSSQQPTSLCAPALNLPSLHSALPGNKADLWMHCLILWSGAATEDGEVTEKINTINTAVFILYYFLKWPQLFSTGDMLI